MASLIFEFARKKVIENMKLNEVFDNEPKRDDGARTFDETYALAQQISDSPEGHNRNERDLVITLNYYYQRAAARP